MPIKVPNDLPAVDTLTKENVFVMTDTRAMTQDIRPLQILILNLMPTKVDTETQLTRLLGNSPLQVELELLQTSSHKAANTSEEHMIAFYKTFDQVRTNYYDGMIITGAPVELMDFEEVDYWDELCEIMEWSKSHVHSTFHICWGAQAGLYYHYGIKKHILPKKLSGVFLHHLDYKNGMLFRGFDDEFYVPHSRNTTVHIEDVEAVPELKVIASSKEAGIFAIKSENDRQIFVMGHSEYEWDTLLKEYMRDKEAGLEPDVPCNYFPDDDDTKEPIVRWRSCANLLYSNWLNYFVYQSTPYDIRMIHEEDLAPVIQEKADLKVAKFGGTSLADAVRFKQAAEVIKNDETRKYVVVSAPGKRRENDVKVTDILIDCTKPDAPAEELLIKVSARYREIIRGLGIKFDLDGEIAEIKDRYDHGAGNEYLISRGEYLCGKIMAEYLGYKFIDAADVIFFDGDGEFLPEKTNEALSKELAKHDHALVPGFYGIDTKGMVRTFSRGGSDITGALVAEAVKADLYENWTDVTGLLMADPKIVKDPLTVPIITYKELRELSVMGAVVMHEDSVFPVRKVGIPINIRNTAKPDEPGTLIVKNADYYQNVLDISGISGKKGYASIVVDKDKLNEDPGFRTNLMKVFTDRGIKIINMLSSIDSLNIIVNENDMKGRIREVTNEIKQVTGASKVTANTGIAMIAVVGREMSTSPAIAVKVLGALASKRINVKIIENGSEKISMSLGVDDADYIHAVKAIYTEFTKK